MWGGLNLDIPHPPHKPGCRHIKAMLSSLCEGVREAPRCGAVDTGRRATLLPHACLL
jgi:hypothetical protein